VEWLEGLSPVLCGAHCRVGHHSGGGKAFMRVSRVTRQESVQILLYTVSGADSVRRSGDRGVHRTGSKSGEGSHPLTGRCRRTVNEASVVSPVGLSTRNGCVQGTDPGCASR